MTAHVDIDISNVEIVGEREAPIGDYALQSDEGGDAQFPQLTPIKWGTT